MSPPRILLTGRWGQVGFELQRTLAPLGEVHGVDKNECDLSDPGALRDLVRAVRPRIIVNAAAYTAVDRAEDDVERARAINAGAPAVIGEEAERIGASVVHFSTDYVFDGSGIRPYVEDDSPAPQNVYGLTKLEGERALQAACDRVLILRTSWVVGAHGSNFAKTMLKAAAQRDELRVVADQHGAPTTAGLLADITAHLVKRMLRVNSDEDCFGVYHVTPTGSTTWHEYAQHVLRYARRAGYPLRVDADGIHPITTREYPTPARRPLNSRLDTIKLQRTFDIYLPDWQSALDHTLCQILRWP